MKNLDIIRRLDSRRVAKPAAPVLPLPKREPSIAEVLVDAAQSDKKDNDAHELAMLAVLTHQDWHGIDEWFDMFKKHASSGHWLLLQGAMAVHQFEVTTSSQNITEDIA